MSAYNELIDSTTMKEINMITTTLKQLREAGACIDGYNKLVRAIQGEQFSEEDELRETYIRFSHKEPISLAFILESNGIDDALWALRACEQTKELQRAERLYGVWCARQVQHLMTDQRSIDALDVAERFAVGEATDEELSAASDAAWAAAWAADRAADRAASDAARAAASDAASDAAWAAAWAADRAASDAARAAQKQKFIEVFCGDDAPNI
jgi:hypothetical protein